MKTETFLLPAYWASYLINGDASGLDDDEQAACDKWLSRNPGAEIVDCSSEQFFSHSNDAGTLPGDCLEYTAIYHEPVCTCPVTRAIVEGTPLPAPELSMQQQVNLANK